MRALMKTARGVGHLELRDHPEPQARPGEVVIAVTLGGICGTDLHILHDSFPYWPPVVLGHEFTGVVAETGDGVDPGLIGSRVVCEPHAGACGTCYLCRRGIAELCSSKRSPGWGIDGAFAPRVAVPAHLLHPVPDGMPDRVAALAEPMAVAVTALGRAGVAPGDVVLVVGPGPIGILSAVAARRLGASAVVVAGRTVGPRLTFAEGVGFTVAAGDDPTTAAVAVRTDGRGADLVVEATGSAAGVALALASVRRRGRMSAVGMSGTPTIEVPWDLAVSRSVDVSFSMSSSFTAWDAGLGILAAESSALEALTTIYPLADWATAFAAVEDRSVIKALLDPMEA